MNNLLPIKSPTFPILTLVSIILFSQSCSYNTDWIYNSEWISEGMKGKVYSVRESHYRPEFKFGSWQSGEQVHNYHRTITSFDNKGRALEIIAYWDEDEESIISKRTLSWEKDKLVEYISYQGDGEIDELARYNYISKNIINAKTYNDSNDLILNQELILKDNRMLKSIESFLPDGIKLNRIETGTWEFNNNGNLIVLKYVNETGSTVWYRKFEYLEFDRKKNWTKRLVFMKDKSIPDLLTIREIDYYRLFEKTKTP